METEGDLSLSYEEKSFEELAKLRDHLIEEDKRYHEHDKWERHRIFRHNNFEELDIRKRIRSENLLKYALTGLGHYIDKNMIEIAKQNGIETPTTLRDFSQPSSISSISFLHSDPQQPGSLFVVDTRNKNNFTYDKRGVIHLKSKKHIRFTANRTRQPLMLSIIAKALRLIGTDNYMTQRELYYKCQQFCRAKKTNPISRPSQSQSSQLAENNENHKPHHATTNLERALSDICCLVGCSKVHLHIIPQSKGLVYGNLRLKLKNNVLIDFMAKKHGTPLPISTMPICSIESDAMFVLVLEKDSVMQKILDQEDKNHFLSKFKAILITGKGYPDWNTRTFVNYLWSKLNIPILALTDADPHGVEIVCSYKFGSYSSAYDGLNVVTPQIKWLGLLPTDVMKLSIDESKTVLQTSNDLNKINSLLARPYIISRPDWSEQLMMMRTMTRKAEIECLDDEFLVTTYLPNKLKYASWL